MRVICRLALLWHRILCPAEGQGCVLETLSGQTGPKAGDGATHLPLHIGYARVSTPEQRLDLQIDALRDARCDVVYREIAPGHCDCRKALAAALLYCKRGDTLVIWKLDRLSRKLLTALQIVEGLRGRGVFVRVLFGDGDGLHSESAEGRLMMGILACFAEFELDLVRERTRAGMSAAKKRLAAPNLLIADQRSLVRFFNELAIVGAT
ncbi:recombinase family protein [Devosia riboflavina]|uniref:recombinase family protein n=1 Tax=Devosia riboflavina TaxID=46914 RepID=UPI000689B203|nr:recombinase family protein [Devosia riboflavina]